MSQETDRMFDALANHQRRYLLFALLEGNPLTEPETYPDSPPDGNEGEDVPVVSNGGEDSGEARARIRRRHGHLPKLDDYGYIVWTRDANGIKRRPRFEEIRPVLELLDEHREDLPD